MAAGAWARSGELTGRIGVFLLRFGLAAPLCGGNRTINGGDSAGNGSLVGTGLCLGGARRPTAAAGYLLGERGEPMLLSDITLAGENRELDTCLTGSADFADRSRFTFDGDKWGSGVVGYNVQVAVDTEHHLIITYEVTNTGSDRSQLANIATTDLHMG